MKFILRIAKSQRRRGRRIWRRRISWNKIKERENERMNEWCEGESIFVVFLLTIFWFGAGIFHCKYSWHSCQVLLVNIRPGLLESFRSAISNVCSSDRMCNHGQILIKCLTLWAALKTCQRLGMVGVACSSQQGKAHLEQTSRPHVARCGYVYMWLVPLKCMHGRVI